MTVHRPVAAAVLAMAILAGPAVHAAPVAIVNASFEADVFGDGGFNLTAPSGWTNIGGTSVGTFNPLVSQLVAPTDGVQVLYINGTGDVRQTLADTVAVGTYTLSADFAFRKDCCGTGDFTMSLLAGGDTLASVTGGLASGFSSTAFKTAEFSVDVVAGAAGIGAPLVIRFQTTAGQTDIDNVRLDFAAAAPVPVPASAWLLLPALAGLGRLARRKAHA